MCTVGRQHAGWHRALLQRLRLKDIRTFPRDAEINCQAWSSVLLRIAFYSESYLSMQAVFKEKQRFTGVNVFQPMCEKLTADTQWCNWQVSNMHAVGGGSHWIIHYAYRRVIESEKQYLHYLNHIFLCMWWGDKPLTFHFYYLVTDR